MPDVATTDGVRVHYELAGAGRAIVFVPGLCTPSRWFDRQVSGLSEKAQVVTIDLRGTGGSERSPRGARVSRYAADVEEVLRHLDLHGVILVGWSLGASIALAYVDLFGTDRLKHLVLVEGGPKLINDAEWSLGYGDLDAATDLLGALTAAYREVLSGLVRSMFVDPDSDPDIAALQAAALDTDLQHTTGLLWNHLNGDWRDVLTHIRLPTTVIAGGMSAIITSEASAWIAATTPNATLRLFPEAGHALFREQYERFNRIIEELV